MVFKTTRQRRRVAIFGGSFNPPHLGHREIISWVFARGIVDEVWVVPCFRHPFGKVLEAFEHRISMCRLAFGGLSLPVRVLNVEGQLGGISYTLRTLEHLKGLYPDIRFSLITGEDVQHEVKLWKEYDRIRDLSDIISIPRGPVSPIPDISSTDIRSRINSSESFAEMVEKEVAIYIITKGLFR